MHTVILRYTKSLKARLIAFGILLVGLGLLGRYVVLLPYLQTDIEALAAAQQASIASYAARDIGGKLEARFRSLAGLATDVPIAQLRQPETMSQWLGDQHGFHDVFGARLAIVPVDEPRLLGVSRQLFGDGAVTATDWYRAVASGAERYVGRPFRSGIDHTPMLVMAVPVREAGGELRAVLAGVMPVGEAGFLDLVQQVHIGATGGLLLISSRDRLFVAAPDPAMALAATPPPGVNRLHDRAMAGYRGTGITINAKGVEELSAIASVPGSDWFVVARTPTAEAFQPVQRIRSFILRNSIFIAVFLVVTLTLVLRYLFGPLSQAAEQMHRMSDGSIPLQPLPVKRDDEVGELTAGFNRLLQRLHANEERMVHMAHHDALTGLPNRPLFDDRVTQALMRAQRGGRQLALLFLDLDGFKAINDRHGHHVGDQTLREVAERLRGTVRASDTVARIGGDEFAVLLPDSQDAADAARRVAGKILACFDRPFGSGGLSLPLGTSIGIVVSVATDDDSAASLLVNADKAMYRAKSAGGNRYELVTAEPDPSA